MLPLKHMFDSYRAGLWVIRRNLFLTGVIAVFSCAHTLFFVLDVPTRVAESFPIFFLIIILISTVIDYLVIGALVLLFHASFLAASFSGTKNRFIDLHRFKRVVLRILGITMVASAASLVILLPFYLGSGPGAIQSGPHPLLKPIGFLVLMIFTASMGLRIPHIILQLNNPNLPTAVADPNTSRSTMPALLLGPALVQGGVSLIFYFNDPVLYPTAVFNPPIVALMLLEISADLLAAAMTAAILSNAYISALRSEIAEGPTGG